MRIESQISRKTRAEMGMVCLDSGSCALCIHLHCILKWDAWCEYCWAFGRSINARGMEVTMLFQHRHGSVSNGVGVLYQLFIKSHA